MDPEDLEQDEEEQTERGYEYETVDETSEDFLCILCRLLVKEARQTECCGRIMCEECLGRYKKTVLTFRCPNCRSPLNGKHFKDATTDRTVQLIKIYCVNKTRGCTWQGKLQELSSHIAEGCIHELKICDACSQVVQRKNLDDHQKKTCKKRDFTCPHCKTTGLHDDITTSHLQVCTHVPLPCPVQGCSQKIRRCDINSHRLVCPNMVVNCLFHAQGCVMMVKRQDIADHCQICPKRHHTCPHCKMEGVYDFINTQHSNECPEVLIPCTNQSCKEKVKRCELDSHYQVCPKEIIKCPYSSIGCAAKIKRDEVDKHEEKNTKEHLRFALRHISLLEAKSHPVVIKCPYTQDNWLSPGFYTSIGGYHAKLNVYIHGKDEGVAGYIAVFFVLIPGKYDDIIDWPFQGDITVELLNQLQDLNHFKVKLRFNGQTPDEVKRRKFDSDEIGSGWGTKKFMSVTEAENPVYANTQFLSNGGMLYFRITVKPSSQTRPWLASENFYTI